MQTLQTLHVFGRWTRTKTFFQQHGVLGRVVETRERLSYKEECSSVVTKNKVDVITEPRHIHTHKLEDWNI